jgi:hypothetical protein
MHGRDLVASRVCTGELRAVIDDAVERHRPRPVEHQLVERRDDATVGEQLDHLVRSPDTDGAEEVAHELVAVAAVEELHERSRGAVATARALTGLAEAGQ